MRPKSFLTPTGIALLLGAGTVLGQPFITHHTFTGTPDGADPQQLVWTNGVFYGSAAGGGTNSNGAIFSYDPAAQLFKPLFSFPGSVDGAFPNNIVATPTAIYGTALNGGTNGYGMLFSMATDGTGFKHLHSFGDSATDGQYPVCGLTLGGPILYGCAHGGGAGTGPTAGGTIFSINTDGSGYNTIYSFTNTPDGSQPQAELLLVGNTLYGTTTYGGTAGLGTVFSINTDGSGYTVLHSFTNSPEPIYPYGKLVLSAGVLYGTGSGGGLNNNGGVFAINVNGTGYTNLYSFSATVGNTDGRIPKASLFLSGSYLYGGTITGGSAIGGTLFLISTNGGSVSVVRSFTNNAASGWDPVGGALRVGNSVWGSTYLGGGGTYGTIYQIPMPAISSQPQSLTVTNTSPAAFAVAAVDDATITFKWYFNTNTLLVGQTANTLTLAQATNENAGTYTVVLSDSFGSVTSSPAALTVIVPGVPPTVTNQPKNFTTLVGGSASFTNGASGTAPLFYQWYFNTNTLLAGETGLIYNIPSTTTNQTGYYTVVVSNSYGMATSTPALLTVTPGVAPTIISQAQNFTATNGFSAAFTNIASGTAPLFYRWYFNTNTPQASGVNLTVLTLSPVNPAQAGYYTAIVSNSFGLATSGPALLTVITGIPPTITTFPQNLTVSNGFNAAFTNIASGTAPLFYRWFFNTNSLVSSGVNNTIFTISPATTNQAGYYTAIVTNQYGGATSPPVLLTVLLPPVKPAIVLNPSNYTVTNGFDATFTNVASGSEPLRYQWYFNNTTPIPDGTNAILTVSVAKASDAGSYRVIVTNIAGSATSTPATLTVISTKPIIVQQPESITVTNGDPYSFTVVAGGQGNLTYQWYTNRIFSGYLQSGQTGPTASFPVASNKYAGNYLVVVTGTLGKATSSPALLTVITKPVITQQPSNTTAVNGFPATFSAEAGGPAPLKFQWFFRTNNLIAGATNTTLVLTNANTNMAGFYSVRVTNTFGAATSSFALLTISNMPVLLTYDFNRTNGNVSFAYAYTPKSTNRLLASTNLASAAAWKAIATNVMATNGLWFYTDPSASKTNPSKFYRFTSP